MTRRHARGGITEGDWNFMARETIAEKADVRKEDEVVIETVETRPCYLAPKISNLPNICTMNLAIPNAGLTNPAQQ